MYVRSAVDILISQPDASATIVVTDSAGTEVPGVFEDTPGTWGSKREVVPV